MGPVFLGNAIALVGALLMVGGGFLRGRKKILTVQCVQFGVQGLSNLILGGITGTVSNLLGIARNLFCLNHELPIPLAIVFVAVQGGLTLGVNKMGVIGWLPVVATAVLTFAMNAKDEVPLKAAIVVGQLCWCVFDLTILNYVSAAMDIFASVSNLWGIVVIYRDRRRGKKNDTAS